MPKFPGQRAPRFQVFGPHNFGKIPQVAALPDERRREIEAVASVLPFRVNSHVVDELIDWERVPDDPIFQLVFPQRGMLEDEAFARMLALVEAGTPRRERQATARDIQLGMNPHPAGQLELNVPGDGDEKLPGLQHKYRETVLFFPAAGQTCHAYCTYCFRWAQFVGLEDLKFAARDSEVLVDYLGQHPEVTDVLVTGGDPLVMKTRRLRAQLEPLLDIPTVRNIRIGTKSLSYWPWRFVGDEDADDLLRLFEEVVARGKHLALMAHYSHPRELEPAVAREALRRVSSTGAVVRCQAPVIRHVNDDAATWAQLWRTQVRLGAVPYYMFVERDTGPRQYFELPLARALSIYQEAYQQVSGLARTVRGPSMSATPGKVLVDGVAEVAGRRVFVLKFLQGREPAWTERVFFAKYDPAARWLDDLEPAFGEEPWFFEEELAAAGRLQA